MLINGEILSSIMFGLKLEFYFINIHIVFNVNNLF